MQRALDQDGPTSYDLDGNHRYDAEVDGRSIRVVTSADNPLFVITVYALEAAHEPRAYVRSRLSTRCICARAPAWRSTRPSSWIRA